MGSLVPLHKKGVGLLLHCVVVDTRMDHIDLPPRVKHLQNTWGMLERGGHKILFIFLLLSRFYLH